MTLGTWHSHPHCTRVGLCDPEDTTEYSRGDGMPPARRGGEWLYGFHHGCSPDLYWILHSMGSQLLCREQSWRGVHVGRNWSFQPTAVKELSSLANSHMNELRRSSTPDKTLYIGNPQPTFSVKLYQRPWARTIQQSHSWISHLWKLWDDKCLLW